MRPVDTRIVDGLRVSGVALGGLVAAVAIYQYMRVTGRPDAAEMRDLWLLVAMELAAIPVAERNAPSEAASVTGLKPTTTI